MNLIESLFFINTMLDNMYEEHLTEIWLHKDLKEPISLEKFISNSLKRRVTNKSNKVLVLDKDKEIDAINFSSKFIKSKEGSE